MPDPIRVRATGDLAEFVPEYLAETRRQLEAARRDGGLAALRTLGHNLRGSGAAFGLDALGLVGRRLETAAAAGDAPTALACASELEDYLNRVIVVAE